MLGLLQNLMSPSGGAVLPGGLVTDGDWLAMTDVNWSDQDGVNFDAWDGTSDGS